MKYLISVLAIALLASCGAKNTETKPTNSGTSSTNTEINKELDSMTGSQTSDKGAANSDKVVKFNADYKAPSWNVTMNVSYELDDSGKIKTIDIQSSANFKWFDEKAEKELLGKTIEEASKLYISGASLASNAFKKAIKS